MKIIFWFSVPMARRRVWGRAAPAHIAFGPDGELAFVGCESSDEVAVIDLLGQHVVERIRAGALGE
jgi:hypothetical protein